MRKTRVLARGTLAAGATVVAALATVAVAAFAQPHGRPAHGTKPKPAASAGADAASNVTPRTNPGRKRISTV